MSAGSWGGRPWLGVLPLAPHPNHVLWSRAMGGGTVLCVDGCDGEEGSGDGRRPELPPAAKGAVGFVIRAPSTMWLRGATGRARNTWPKYVHPPKVLTDSYGESTRECEAQTEAQPRERSRGQRGAARPRRFVPQPLTLLRVFGVQRRSCAVREHETLSRVGRRPAPVSPPPPLRDRKSVV